MEIRIAVLLGVCAGFVAGLPLGYKSGAVLSFPLVMPLSSVGDCGAEKSPAKPLIDVSMFTINGKPIAKLEDCSSKK